MKGWLSGFPSGAAAVSGVFTGAVSVVFGIGTGNPQAWVFNFPCGFILGFFLIAVVYTWAYLMEGGK
jgi:hypothetical protein